MIRRILPIASLALSLSLIFVRASSAATAIIVSVPDQRLMLVQDGVKKGKVYPVSTSRFGLGDRPRSYATPLGELQVASKIGDAAQPGTVFRGLRPTGEVLQPNTPGRDPIVTRIMTLRGLQPQNAHASCRGIYIHGTPEERLIGRPASYGCIRMRSKDVVKVFEETPVGTKVEIVNAPLSNTVKALQEQGGKAGSAS